MSKNAWVACFIVVIFFLCVGVFCVLVSMIGVASYIHISPTLSLNLPFLPVEIGSPTPSPIVIRPSPQGFMSSPTSPSGPVTPQIELSTPVPTSTNFPTFVETDTIQTLDNTIIPIIDPIDLAHRLLGVVDLSLTVAPPTTYYSVGAQQSFWVGNGDVENFRVQATLQFVTDHAYFWIEDGVQFRQRDLSALANTFESQIYPTDRSFFGSEWTPGVDGDPHIYILYVRGIGDNILGYFSSADEYPNTIYKYSNTHEIFQLNADNLPLGNQNTYGTLAHEFQHMIHWYQDRNEANWLNEGFSELAVLLNNFPLGSFDALYTSNPDLQLNNWPDDSKEDSTPHYGASFLFVTYFLDRFGESATKALVTNQDNDLKSVDSTLQQFNKLDPLTGKASTADSFFLDWAVTNYLIDQRVGDGRYAYTSYQGPPPAEATENVYSCPIGDLTRDVHQYGVDYIRFNCPGSYTLHFEGSIQTPLLPQNPHSGQFAFWSNKNDESDTTLTRNFDLTTFSGPVSLSYWTWYDIENGWDYVYLEASTDGVNWQILTTPSGTADNPQGNSYGWGCTGTSGAGSSPGWIHEMVDLSQFAGTQVNLRFEYITDSNVTGEGFLLDDIAIPAIGYSSDFESDAGDWQTAGWARIQNLLPQSYRLALITVGDNTRIQDITLNPDISADIPFTIGNGIDNVVLVVSGTTRYTRQLAPYRFSVSQP